MAKKHVFEKNVLTFNDTIKEEFFIPRYIAREFFGKKVKVTMVIE